MTVQRGHRREDPLWSADLLSLNLYPIRRGPAMRSGWGIPGCVMLPMGSSPLGGTRNRVGLCEDVEGGLGFAKGGGDLDAGNGVGDGLAEFPGDLNAHLEAFVAGSAGCHSL